MGFSRSRGASINHEIFEEGKGSIKTLQWINFENWQLEYANKFVLKLLSRCAQIINHVIGKGGVRPKVA